MVSPRLSNRLIGGIEEIKWVDCEGSSGWDTVEAHQLKVGGKLTVVSVGYFLCEDELTVSLVQSHDLKNGTVDAYITIPKCSITKRVAFKSKLEQPKS
jgi:hypothetical protein